MAKVKRVPLNRLVLPGTFDTVKLLADQLECSEGEVVDKAIEALAVAQSFGSEHLSAAPTPHQTTIVTGTYKQPEPEVKAVHMRKLSKKAQAAESRKAADPLAQALGREDIDYMNPDELPSAGSVGSVGMSHLDAVGTTGGKAFVETWRANRKPLMKPKERK